MQVDIYLPVHLNALHHLTALHHTHVQVEELACASQLQSLAANQEPLPAPGHKY